MKPLTELYKSACKDGNTSNLKLGLALLHKEYKSDSNYDVQEKLLDGVIIACHNGHLNIVDFLLTPFKHDGNNSKNNIVSSPHLMEYFKFDNTEKFPIDVPAEISSVYTGMDLKDYLAKQEGFITVWTSSQPVNERFIEKALQSAGAAGYLEIVKYMAENYHVSKSAYTVSVDGIVAHNHDHIIKYLLSEKKLNHDHPDELFRYYMQNKNSAMINYLIADYKLQPTKNIKAILKDYVSSPWGQHATKLFSTIALKEKLKNDLKDNLPNNILPDANNIHESLATEKSSNIDVVKENIAIKRRKI